ncbi:MAG: hypothetical protein DWQ48_07615 [Bacteroidetes bacterium]|nr:MAG: hypothetical protein DWQ48_07615 [Bacteroidota bacterium]
MKSSYKNCQSCGMPLKKDPKGGGSNAAGTIRHIYCSLCFENGKFPNPDWTADQLQEFVNVNLKEIGIPGFLVAWISKGIPQLERWK